MQEKANKPALRFKGFDEDWEQRKAKKLFVATADKGHPELPVLSATQDRGMIRRDENSINVYHDKKNEAGYKRVLPGQFVIHLRSFQGGFAHSTIEGITSPAYTVFDFSDPVKHDSEYWKHVFTSKAFIQRLETVTYGIRDGRSISYNEFLTMKFMYPSKKEQTEIARYLDALDNLITLHQRKYTKLVNIKKAMLEKMFPKNGEDVPEIRFAGFTDPWEQRKFSELFKRRMERNNGQFDKTKWISVANMYYQDPDKVTSNNIDTRTYVLRLGDISFEGHSNKEFKIGRFVENDIGDGVISELFPIYQHITSYDLNFWKYYINIENIMFPKLQRCIEVSYTSSNKLSEKFFLKESILVPAILEQKKIGTYLKKIDNLITLHQREYICVKNGGKLC